MTALRDAIALVKPRGLFDNYGSSPQSKPKIYFPYAPADQDRAVFERGGRIDACIPVRRLMRMVLAGGKNP